MANQKVGKGGRKIGRNRAKCEVYRRLGKHDRAHVNKIEKHLRFHKKDRQAIEALELYKGRV